MLVELTREQRKNDRIRYRRNHLPAYLYREGSPETPELKERFRRIEGREMRLQRYRWRADKQQPLFSEKEPSAAREGSP